MAALAFLLRVQAMERVRMLPTYRQRLRFASIDHLTRPAVCSLLQAHQNQVYKLHTGPVEHQQQQKLVRSFHEFLVGL